MNAYRLCICMHIYIYLYVYILICIMYVGMHACVCMCMAMFLCAWRPEVSTRYLPLHPLVETATLSLNPEAG